MQWGQSWDNYLKNAHCRLNAHYKGWRGGGNWKESREVNTKPTGNALLSIAIDPLQDPVTWYRINYAGTQVTQWNFKNKGTRTSPARLSFFLEVPLCKLRPSIIYSVPCDRILQRAYFNNLNKAA